MPSSKPNLLLGRPTKWAKVQSSPIGTLATHFPAFVILHWIKSSLTTYRRMYNLLFNIDINM
eukprot:12769212-Heterocapsa_arctica.AAC.1